MSTLVFAARSADYSSSGGVLTVGVFVFGFAMIILAITIVSMRVGHSNRELAKLRKRSDLQQREAGVAQADVDAVRRAAVVEALRRDPSLRDASDPESLRRLSALIEEVQEKLQLAGELNLVRRTEEDQSRWDDQRAATDRKAAEQRLEADRKAAERKAQVDAMPPFRRRIVRNPLISGLVVAASIGAVILVGSTVSSRFAEASARAEDAAAAAAAATRQQELGQQQAAVESWTASCDPTATSATGGEGQFTRCAAWLSGPLLLRRELG